MNTYQEIALFNKLEEIKQLIVDPATLQAPEPIENHLSAESVTRMSEEVFNVIEKSYPLDANENLIKILDVTLKHGIELGIIYYHESK
jgi:hypothetical protein